MKFNNKGMDGTCIYTDIDIADTDNVILLKEFFIHEFTNGQEIVFNCFRKESLTDTRDLKNIENDLVDIFDDENLYIIDFLDDSRFHFLYRHEFNFNSPNLMVKFWKYFYSLSFFVLNKGYSFEDAKVYFKNHKKKDIHLKNFLKHGFSDIAYIKGLGGDILIKQISQQSK